MYINIITPCSRPQHLHKISESINIPKENYRWIVVFDSNELPEKDLIPENCEVYLHTNKKSIVGNSQRNFALDLVERGHVYFNDDDTILHKDLWESVKDLDDDFIHFKQSWKNGLLRMNNDVVKVQKIDSHNFIVSKSAIGEIRWRESIYEADGYFAVECYENSKTKKKVDKVLSTYNSLR